MRIGLSSALLVAAATAEPLLAYVQSAQSNVILPCMRNYTLADTPASAAAPSPCSWNDYDRFVSSAGIGWSDAAGSSSRAAADPSGVVHPDLAEQTMSITTALTIVEALRLSLGDAAYATRTEPVTIDMVGWAFTWVDRPVVEDTSNTVEVTPWDDLTERATKRYWGAQIGGALRRMLPLVKAITVRGYGPEAPPLSATPLRADSWLLLQLHPGVYSSLSEPAPTLTLLENSGLHDDLWPSDGGCISDKQLFHIVEAAELQRRTAAGEIEALGLGCLWRQTVELMAASDRTFWATSYQSHEHLLAIDNLRAIGAKLVHAFPNGFSEIGSGLLPFDFDTPEGLIGESLRDAHPRRWGRTEALYAYTSAIWRHRIAQLGFEPRVLASRNRYVLAFRGGSGGGSFRQEASNAQRAYGAQWRSVMAASSIQKRLQTAACGAAALPSTPPRQSQILRAAWWCDGDERWSETPSQAAPAPAESSCRSEQAEALSAKAAQLREEGRAEDAVQAYEAALAAAPDDFALRAGMAAALGDLDQHERAAGAYRAALQLRPRDVSSWISLGVRLSLLEGQEEAALEAFHQAVEAAPNSDARAPMTLGRYLAQLMRPAEAIEAFYGAAGADVDVFEEAKAAVGSARAQQGRLREAISHLETASRLNPQNDRITDAIANMRRTAAAVEAASAGASNAVTDICGTPCQDVVDGSSTSVCSVSWEEGCGAVPPPPGFSSQSTVAQLCAGACAFYNYQAGLQRRRDS